MSNVPTVDGPAFIRAIEDSGLSKAELARRSGVSLSHIKNICGGFPARRRTAQALADTLKIDLSVFWSVPTPRINGDAA